MLEILPSINLFVRYPPEAASLRFLNITEPSFRPDFTPLTRTLAKGLFKDLFIQTPSDVLGRQQVARTRRTIMLPKCMILLQWLRSD